MNTVIVRYAEIALKSGPVRSRFENILLSNIQDTLGKIPHEIRRERGRIYVDTKNAKKVSLILSKVPGIVSTSPALRVPPDLEEITSEAISIARKFLRAGDTFAVRTTREGKHPFGSREVNERVGREILSAVGGSRVNLSAPKKTLFVEVRGEDAYVFKEVVRGIGGLPVGSQGTVLVIFSGGRKDVAAALLMLKRGCYVKLLSFVGKSGDVKRKVSAAKRLLKHHPRLELLVVHFKEIQMKTKKAKPDIRPYIGRRAEMRAAKLVAEKVRAHAIVTGDDVGYLSRMGLSGLRLVDSVCGMLVLRPLLGKGMEERALGEAARVRRREKAPITEEELKDAEGKLIPRGAIEKAVEGTEIFGLRSGK